MRGGTGRPRRLAERAEEIAQQPRAFVCEDSADHLDGPAEPWVVQHIPDRARRASPGIMSAVDQSC